MKQKQLTVVLPCFNEESAIFTCATRLTALEEQLSDLHLNLEVIIVDDGSVDQSVQMIKKHLPSAKIIEHGKNLGYGQALKSGFQQAQGDFVAMMDIDSTYDALEIFKLVNALQLQSLDLVIGQRLQDDIGFNSWRRFGNKLMQFFSRHLLYKTNLDVCSGMRVMRQNFAKQLCQVPQNGFSFAISILEHAHLNNLVIDQVPISYSKRMGSSKLNSFYEGCSHLTLIFKFWLMR